MSFNRGMTTSKTDEWETPQWKFCPRCKTMRPANEFPIRTKPNGQIRLYSYCRECVRLKNREQYLSNRESRLRSAADYRANNPEKVKNFKSAWKKKWRSANPEKARALACVEAKAYRLANPEKENARRQVKKAIQSGSLIRGACIICGSTERIEGHHEDYSKALDVVWLCKKHHIALHKGEISL